MPQFSSGWDDPNQVDAGTVAGVGGILGAIPGLNVLAPGITSALGASGRQSAIEQQQRNAEAITGPVYGSDRGVQMQYSGDFNPQMYADPEAAQYELAADSAEGRAAQLAALQEMARLTDQSAGSTSRLGRQNAEMDARQLSQSREGMIRQDAMRRGQVGGAADMIARQQAAQAASNQNLNAGLQNAQQAALMELAGTQAGSQMAGQLRGQDQNLALANAGIMNQFNMANTNARNSIRGLNTQLANAGQLRNLDARQGFNNAGTNLAMQKLQRGDRNADSGFGAQMQKFGAVNQGLGAEAALYDSAAQQGNAAGAQGFGNLKDLAKFGAGGLGGLMGGK